MDKQEVIKGLKAVRTIHNGNYAPAIDEAIKLLGKEKTGRWLSTWHKDEVVCSNCRKYWVLATDVYDYKYCPNCGARMED